MLKKDLQFCNSSLEVLENEDGVFVCFVGESHDPTFILRIS
jgi:hypothetical protein